MSLKRLVLPLAALLVLSAASCSRHLTLVTWNVGVFDKYGDSREAVAAVIRDLGADLVSLNELDSCNRRHAVYQLEDLAGRLGWEGHFVSAFPFAGGGYGNGVVSSRPVLSRSALHLPKFDGYEPRSVAVVETADCVFASVHLDVASGTASQQQAEILNAWFLERYAGCPKPVFLCGDMNSRPDSGTIRILSQAWELLSATGPTYPSDAPDRCIDYIFRLRSARPVKVRSTRVVTDGPVPGLTSGPAPGLPYGPDPSSHPAPTGRGPVTSIATASDHLPVVVSVRF